MPPRALSRVGAITIAEPPEIVAVAAPALGLPSQLYAALDELTRDLGRAALHDARFEHAAALASQLQIELQRLLGGQIATVRRSTTRRPRSARATARLVQALRAESIALERTCQLAREQGIHIERKDLADLRLGERTRRIFHEAGLTNIEDVTTLPAERAAEIPHLAPTSLAELRAAIMFVLEVEGKRPPAALPPPGHSEDLFEGLVAGVNVLPPRERDILVLRAGVEDRVHSIDEVARTLGCTPEQVDRAEEHALNALLSQPASLEASWQVEELCLRMGLAWDDERLPTAIAAYYPNTRASFARLAAWLMVERGRQAAEAGGREFTPPQGVPHFEEMVVATLGRYGDLPGETLTEHVRAALAPSDRDRYTQLAVSERVRILGPAVPLDSGAFHLPDAPIPDIDDRHIRALNGLIGALQKLGSARIAALTSEVNRRLPRAYHVNDQFVRTWLTRHPELFTQYEQDRFKLASLDVDILIGLANSWLPGNGQPGTVPARPAAAALDKRNERIANDIAAFLREHGPQTIGRIRSHLYGRFIGQASADAVIATDSQQRFIKLGGGLIGLRDGAAQPEEPAVPINVPPSRGPAWHRAF
ncbi:MAG TPA: sigma factor-like helix-turn-helix DNA-binding protein [Chloroflexota bacterium]